MRVGSSVTGPRASAAVRAGEAPSDDPESRWTTERERADREVQRLWIATPAWFERSIREHAQRRRRGILERRAELRVFTADAEDVAMRGAVPREHHGAHDESSPGGTTATSAAVAADVRVPHLLDFCGASADACGSGVASRVSELPTRAFRSKFSASNAAAAEAGDGSDEAKDNTTECAICMEDFEEGTALRRLPCLHEFHVHCADRWLEAHGTCPVCRRRAVDVQPAVAGGSGPRLMPG